jgi:hypothetical protein
MYDVRIIADSINKSNNRLTTMQVRYWRAIHAEVMTHRVFSRNASSSRAIPVSKMIKQVWDDPAGPLHWGVNRPGMQARAELFGWRRALAGGLWRTASKIACGFAWGMMKLGVHKQVANRLLEPFQYISVIISATEWDNFFELRAHPDAQPEIQHLALLMERVMRHSVPRYVNPGDWHLPYVTSADWTAAQLICQKDRITRDMPKFHEMLEITRKLSTARCARVSYLTHDGVTPAINKDIKLHDDLVVSRPIHASPAEHQAMALDDSSQCKNFRGWQQYRDLLEND